ncbi:hypothetical protein IFM89_033030 [Coptis chinensis]|uniref:Bet v I/Major latex protein domain-containing protein n=1 Tax=Coptis chinensis TaxID=261450 RepID=A0A835M2T7_9MAGN|nr:hypothetical protein IFM89_033030 [Coptis chinensis]
MWNEVLFVLLMFLGTMNCNNLVVSGRPLLHGITNKESTVSKVLEHELKVAASADEVWSVYGSPELPMHLLEMLPGSFEKVKITGDGGVGTIIDLTFPPGEFPHAYKEKFVFIDHKLRILKVQIIDGDYANLGVTYYMDTIIVVETGPDSCVIKSSMEYYVKPEFANIVEPLIDTVSVASMAEAVAKKVLEEKHKSSEENPSITTPFGPTQERGQN